MRHDEPLLAALKHFAELAHDHPLTMGEAFDQLHQGAFTFVAILLVLPLMQPVPLGPFSVLGGMAFVGLGWQLWQGHTTPNLPQRLRVMALKQSTWLTLFTVCTKVMGVFRKISRPRLKRFTQGNVGKRWCGGILMVGGALMAIPFGVLPFNNLLPGLGILSACLGLLEEDGLLTLLGVAWLVLTTIYFLIFFVGVYYLSHQAMHWLA